MVYISASNVIRYYSSELMRAQRYSGPFHPATNQHCILESGTSSMRVRRVCTVETGSTYRFFVRLSLEHRSGLRIRSKDIKGTR